MPSFQYNNKIIKILHNKIYYPLKIYYTMLHNTFTNIFRISTRNSHSNNQKPQPHIHSHVKLIYLNYPSNWKAQVVNPFWYDVWILLDPRPRSTGRSYRITKLDKTQQRPTRPIETWAKCKKRTFSQKIPLPYWETLLSKDAKTR